MDESIRDEILAKRPEISPLLWVIFGSLFIVGVFVFLSNAFTEEHSQDTWQIFLINFIFWTGIAQAGIVFSAILRLTRGKWGRPLLRVSEALGSFVPVSFVLLLVLLFIGKDYVLPYIIEPYPYAAKEVWLAPGFVVGRHLFAFGLLFLLSMYYLYFSLRQDLGGAGEKLSGFAAWIAEGWKGDEEREEIWGKLVKLSPAVVIIYAFTFSLIGWDFMMSLDPHWFSTLFGPYYFMGSILGAVGMIIILSSYLRKHMALREYITDHQYFDISKIMLGLSMFWVYLTFSQFLPIWYANMPEETGFVIARTQVEPFATLSWVVLSCCFFFPFVSLIPRTTKVINQLTIFIAVVSLSGLWLEKYVLIVPSISHGIHFGFIEILITAGFAS
ncbi:MAG: hypothetical protein GWO07_03195, partial [Candidatus Dadabacteria bacterium]|nr:hypothetical protein [Candidatus Dadabacteria bacterium]NIS07771.1 hypothetical protein [Candidatus Dadabacteria bacterium]NIV41824.1 hypothetical protein [Candidatus Dadabacteria bacterium]NIX16355.1 hypothetical protein [Candidatus Dadabacteria bacterium]NIY22913.1 hypothetical protein [Candidatus Dadabacteria bacterium]